MIAVCREVDKNSGKIAVYPLNVAVTDDLLLKLSIRGRMNPELRYFVVFRRKWESEEAELKRILKRKTVTPKQLELNGVIEV